MTTLRVDSIELGERHRQDMGDIDSLARSIVELGLLHPIVVTPELKLIAGQRRLEAFKQLGREEIPVTVIDLEEVIRGEWAENAERKAFTPSEAVAIGRIIEERERAKGKERLGHNQYTSLSEKFSETTQHRTRDIVGAALGMSGPTYEAAKTVVALAEEDPETFGPIKEEMDRTGRPHPAYAKTRRVKAGESPAAAPPRNSRIAIATRREHIIRMGKERHSVDAIAAKVGVNAQLVSEVLRNEGIELVSERIGRLHKVDANETMEGLVNQAVPAENAVSLVLADWESLDRAQFQRWSEELRSAIRTLSRLERKLH
jgi:hypothetical protein